MTQAAKWGDLVLGLDIHQVIVPGAPGPVPLPHLFVGVVFDPAAAAIGALMGSGAVLINGLPVANTGTGVRGIKHVPTPPGTAFAPNDLPDSQGDLVTGSKTVSMAGSSCGRLSSMVSSCNFPVNLPTSVCLAIPAGAPVLIGGPDAMDFTAAVTRGIRTKWFSNALHSLLKPGKRLSWVICFLTGHPVDVMTGEVLTQAVDFELPGAIPLVFERMYSSRDSSDGPMGPGWHHPLDACVREEGRRIKVTLPDGRESPHEALAVGESAWDAIDRYTLLRTKSGYRLTFWDGRCLHFEPVPGAPVSHALVRITDRCENAIELRYQQGRLAEVTDSVGRRLRFTTSGGRLVGVKLRRRDGEWMDLVRYAYDSEGRLSAALDPAGVPFRYAYKGGVLVKETNRNGLSFHFEYDGYHPDGWCVRTWGDGGIYDRKITYDKHRHVTLVDDSRGGRTHYYGNRGGLVDREVDPTGRETRYEWHPTQYRKTAQMDGLGHRTEWAYDERGNTVLERDPLGHETRWTYDALNVAVECVDAVGSVWKLDHDRRGRPVRAENPLGEATRLQHDRFGNLVCVEDPQGRRLELRYTDVGELSQVSDWEGHVTLYAWDDRGQLVRQVDALGGETAITRDACGRPVAVRRPDGSVLRMAYDAEGNLVEQTDALGNITRYRYAGLNQRVERIDPLGGVVRYRHDTEEDLVGVTNELGEEYGFELDLAGRVVKERGFDGRLLELRYDRAGRCIETVNGRKKRTKIERDALGRIIKQVVPKDPVMGDPIPTGEQYEYGFDALGHLARARNDACEVTFRRDALGRVIEERAGEHVIESRYDASGNRVGRRTSLEHETLYDFDGNGDLLAVTFGVDPRWMDFTPEALKAGGPVRAPWRATFRRDALGSETERCLPGEVVSRWERDSVGRPRVNRVFQEDAQVSAVGYCWHSYERLAGLIDTQKGKTCFEHDARSYLVAAIGPDGSVQHRAPDAVGNVYRTRERTDRAYGRGGLLREADGVQYSHDADGQLIATVLPDGTRWSYCWDHAGQLREVTRPDGQKVRFAYDALGRRVRKSFGGKTTTYLWDGDDLVHELAETAEPVTWVFEPGTFAPLAKAEGDRRYAVVTDHLGTPQALLDEAGKLAWKAQLDVYGVAQVVAMMTECSWRWPGQYEDEETGLYYNRFRYYDPEQRRYISQDPVRLAGGYALYGYPTDPLRWTDPLGLAGKCNKVERQWEKWADFKHDSFRRLGADQRKMAANMIDMFQQRYLAGVGEAMPNIRNMNNLGERLWEIKHKRGVRVYIDALGNVLAYGHKNSQPQDIPHLKRLLDGLI